MKTTTIDIIHDRDDQVAVITKQIRAAVVGADRLLTAYKERVPAKETMVIYTGGSD